MAVSQRSRVFSLLSLLMLFLQFPITKVKVPQAFRDSVAADSFFLSIPQIVTSAYVNNANVPPQALRWLMAPGLLTYDINNKLQCKLERDMKACDAPVYTKQLDRVFEMTTPIMGRSDIITTAIHEAMGQQAALLQAGASLTIGAALISLLFPVKVGVLGYALVLWSLFQSGQVLLPPALVFAPIFVIATDVLSLFRARQKLPATTAGEQHAQSSIKAPTRQSTTAGSNKAKAPRA